MSWNNKVVWSEGMFLQPQHFQQHDRWLQTLLETRTGPLRPYPWGYADLQIDKDKLKLGKLALASCHAVLPDGTPLHLSPTDDAPPLPFDVPEDARNVLVVLALPLRSATNPETGNADQADNYARYRTEDQDEVRDSNGGEETAQMQVGKLRLRLALEGEAINAYTSMGVARIVERLPDGRVVLDPDYCPPCLNFRVAPRIGGFADELVGMLRQRGDALAARLSQPGVTGAAEVVDYLLLQLVNRALPLFSHYHRMSGLHPEELYRALVGLAGELSTFSQPDRRAAEYPAYMHNKLRETFFPVIDDLRRFLAVVMDPHAVALRLEERQFGIRVAVLPDLNLLKTAVFVLAVHAQMPPEAVRSGFPLHVKIGPVEKIRDLVNLQLAGIALRPLPVAPRQLPFHAGYTYFELDSTSEFWKQLSTSAGFALHVAGEFPGLTMQFWAIKG